MTTSRISQAHSEFLVTYMVAIIWLQNHQRFFSSINNNLCFGTKRLKKKRCLAFPAGLRARILTTWLRQYSLMIVMWPNPSNHSLYLNTVSDLTCQSFWVAIWESDRPLLLLLQVNYAQLTWCSSKTHVCTHTQRYMHKKHTYTHTLRHSFRLAVRVHIR